MLLYSKQIFFFTIKLIPFLLGFSIKFILAEVLFLESEDLENLNDSDSDQTFVEKFKNLPWGWILLWSSITF